MSGPPPESAARDTTCSWLSAAATSPDGIRGAAGSCGGPHTPSGNAPKGSVWGAPNGQACGVPPSRVQRSMSVGSIEDVPIGPMPSSRVGGTGTRTPVVSTPVVGTVEVTVSTNSAVTTYGRSGLPSGVCGAGPPEVRGGTAPADTMPDNPPATPACASSRYLAMNSGACNRTVAWSVVDPKGTVTVHGPKSISARPWKSGPSTSIEPPREIEMVISPNQVSMVTPAAMRTYAFTL